MRCKRCGFELKDSWDFCPLCGARKGGNEAEMFGRDLFSELFSRVKDSIHDFDDMDRLFEKNIEALDLSPWFRKISEDKKGFKPVQGRGFTIHIRSGTGRPPDISVKTFGDVDKSVVEKELRKMGTPGGIREGSGEKPGQRIRMPSLRKERVPKITEEPKAEVRRLGSSVIVDVTLPGVKSGDDIDIKELESSVEVKAFAGDRAFFKILTKPAQFRLTGRSFQNGVLHLEFS